MGTTYILANAISNSSSPTESVASGDELVVLANVDVINEASRSTYDAIDFAYNGYADIQGSVYGPNGIYFLGGQTYGYGDQVYIEATGSVQGLEGPALDIASGTYSIINNGSLNGFGGVVLDYSDFLQFAGSGGGALVNNGTISSSLDTAVVNYDTSPTNEDTLTNYGRIVSSNDGGIAYFGSGATIVNNYGSILGGGGYGIAANGAETLTNTGEVSGGVAVGAASSIVNSGEIDGATSVGANSTITNSGKMNGAVGLGAGSALSDSGDIDGAVTIAAATGLLSFSSVSISSTGKILAAGTTALGIVGGPYDVSNAGSINVEGLGDAVNFGSGAGAFVNSGSIHAVAYGVANSAGAGSDDYLFNSGTISGDVTGVSDTGGHTAKVVNFGSISSGTLTSEYAVSADATTQERLVNGGTLSGAVSLAAASSTVVNSGAIEGAVTLGAGSGRIVNTGSIDGAIAFAGSGNVYLGMGGSFTGTLMGAGADGRYYAGAGLETFDLSASGAKLAVGGTGDAIFDYGATFTNSMAVQGGGATEVDLDGNYAQGSSGELFLGARTMIGVDKIVLGAGFGYAIHLNAATVANGATMTVDGSALGAGDNLFFDASRDVGGYLDLIGGAGTDNFLFATYNLFANDVLLGGTGAGDTITFKTAGNVTAQQFANVSGISTIKVAVGTNDIQLSDFMVTKAFNHALTVNVSAGADTIDASLLTTASNTLTINAVNASGGDTFLLGAETDTVNFAASPTSNSVNYDTISNFNFAAGDAIGVAGYAPSSIASAVSGSLSTATFDSDLAAALGPSRLTAGAALLFTANAGTLAADTFLIASTNGSAGYTSGDLVVRLTGATTGTLGLSNV